MNIRVGHGFDIHTLETGRTCIIGGVELPSQVGPKGHSDGDPLIHAVIDAILGATGQDDIGTHFPDSDDEWAGASGETLAGHLLTLIPGWEIINIDTTVICETPRIGPYREAIRERLSEIFEISTEQVNLKAKTHEHHDAIGRGEAIACHAVVLLSRKIHDDDTWL